MFPATLTGGFNPYSWTKLKPAPGGGWEPTEESGTLNAYDPQDRAAINAPVVWLVPGVKGEGGDFRIVSP